MYLFVLWLDGDISVLGVVVVHKVCRAGSIRNTGCVLVGPLSWFGLSCPSFFHLGDASPLPLVHVGTPDTVTPAISANRANFSLLLGYRITQVE